MLRTRYTLPLTVAVLALAGCSSGTDAGVLPDGAPTTVPDGYATIDSGAGPVALVEEPDGEAGTVPAEDAVVVEDLLTQVLYSVPEGEDPTLVQPTRVGEVGQSVYEQFGTPIVVVYQQESGAGDWFVAAYDPENGGVATTSAPSHDVALEVLEGYTGTHTVLDLGA